MFLQKKITPKIASIATLIVTISFAFILLSAISACSGGGNKQPSNADTTGNNATYTPSNSSSVYDPTKIDASAPVMEVKLEAQGNSMDVMSFSMQEIRVKAGTTVKLHFANTAKDQAMKHNFFIVKNGTMEQVATAGLAAGVDKNYIPDDKTNILYSSNILEPGQSEDLTFPAPPAGEYQFVCTYPGHWQKMNGKFIVE